MNEIDANKGTINHDSLANKYASADPKPAKVRSVVQAPAKVKKRSKLAEVFLPGDMEDIKRMIVEDILVPSAKKMIMDGIDMLLWGGKGSHLNNNSYGTTVTYRNYNAMSSQPRQYSSNQPLKATYNYDTVILQSRGDAERVLRQMDDIVDTYGFVKVSDLYELCNVSGDYTANGYGWTNIRNSEVVRVRDGYTIKLPKAHPID